MCHVACHSCQCEPSITSTKAVKKPLPRDAPCTGSVHCPAPATQCQDSHRERNDRLRRNPQHDTHRRPGCDPVCSEQARYICTSTIVSRVLDTKPLLLPIRRSDPARFLLTWLNFDRFHTPCLLERTDYIVIFLSSLWAVTHVGQVKHLISGRSKE